MAEADFGGHRHRAAPAPQPTASPQSTMSAQPTTPAPGVAALESLARGRPGLLWLIRHRRQLLISLGIGGVAAAGLGSTVALFAKGDPLAAVADGMSPKRAGSFSDRDASYSIGMGDGSSLGAQG